VLFAVICLLVFVQNAFLRCIFLFLDFIIDISRFLRLKKFFHNCHFTQIPIAGKDTAPAPFAFSFDIALQ